jgi:hypothetical protein
MSNAPILGNDMTGTGAKGKKIEWSGKPGYEK